MLRYQCVLDIAQNFFGLLGKWAFVPLFLLFGTERGKERERTVLTKKEGQILAALEPLASESGIEIVTVEVIGSSRSPVIRVYIDSDEGVSFKELTESQDWIGQTIEDMDPFPGAYTLEVSSPGIDRPLRTEDHFTRFAGEEAKVRTISPIDGRANFKGTIVSAGEGCVVLDIDGEHVSIPLDSMRRANLVGRIDF